jgi:hypothetical protein
MPGSAEQAATGSLVVPMPVNDWESVALLIPRLDATLRQCAPVSRLVSVDDASTEPPPDQDRPEGVLTRCALLHPGNGPGVSE